MAPHLAPPMDRSRAVSLIRKPSGETQTFSGHDGDWALARGGGMK